MKIYFFAGGVGNPKCDAFIQQDPGGVLRFTGAMMRKQSKETKHE
jgi:hypothetical protein